MAGAADTPTLVVMAAGRGSRYGGAKQLDEVGPGGETLLDYAVFDASRVGFSRIVIVTRADLVDACRARSAHFTDGLDVRCVAQRARIGLAATPRRRPWGTVHAVLSADPPDDAPVVALNADDFYGRVAYERARRACERATTSGEATVITMPLDQTLSEHGPVVRAVCNDDDGLLTRLDEIRDVTRTADGISGLTLAGDRRTLRGDELVSMNLWILPASVLHQLADALDRFVRAHARDADAELPLPEAIGDLIAQRLVTVRVDTSPGPWFGLTHADDRADVVAALGRLADAGEYPSPLWPRR